MTDKELEVINNLKDVIYLLCTMENQQSPEKEITKNRIAQMRDNSLVMFGDLFIPHSEEFSIALYQIKLEVGQL